MLVSPRYGYIFAHIAKTGGTSVRSVLAARRRHEPSYWATWLSDRLSRGFGHRLGIKIPRHAPAIVAREMLPPQMFAEMYKFAFVRNPWDRMVSAYVHYQRERQDILVGQHIESFADFVDFVLDTPAERAPRAALLRSIQRPQLESLIGLHGELLVDYVGRFESIAADFREVMTQLALPACDLPHKRKGQATRDYRRCYSDSLAERVGKHFADDLAAFQYEFDLPGAASNDTHGLASPASTIAGTIQPVDGAVERMGRQ